MNTATFPSVPFLLSSRWIGWAVRHWFILLALLIFAGPSLLTLARESWSTEQGAGGPLILASGIWLLLREARGIQVAPPHISPFWWLSLAPIVLTTIAGRIFGMIWLDWLATYGVLLWVARASIGLPSLLRLWFPLTYLLFIVPPPYTLVSVISHSRKLWLATTSVDILSALGFDAAYSGTTLYIDQYELLIANACAGMSSLTSLLAIVFFYTYVQHRANWRYALLLALLSVPVAMIANLVRVMILMLIAHYAGLDASKGPAHEIAGIVMYLVALFVMLALDAILAPLCRFLARR